MRETRKLIVRQTEKNDMREHREAKSIFLWKRNQNEETKWKRM